MTTKKQRSAKARAVAKRIPVVGTTVAFLPAVQAFEQAGLNASNLTSMATWANVGKQLMKNYTGYDIDGQKFDGVRAVQTYLPVVVYVLAKKTKLSHPISKAFGKVGVAF